ncbi:MAG: hypothetical protein J6S85_13680 [Methanobrevibacter sp.]|nr:hypothetical protein [Methanobrevibacter sp.]
MDKKTIDRQNKYIKENYDRFTATFPHGKKEAYQELAKNQGKRLNTVINELLQDWYTDCIAAQSNRTEDK